MSHLPGELKYCESHEWIRKDADGIYTVGITEYAQEMLGDVVFVDLPETGKAVIAGECCAVVESVKSASDICAPVAGEIVTSNRALSDSPEWVNSAPYGDGWLFRIKIDNAENTDALLAADAYRALIGE